MPDEDDVVVERLRTAGAIVIGKTNTSEFGYSATGHNPIFETTRNPWNPALTPGGSSAGAGVAVATGVGPIAIGSDGGGSVRIPAAHCGVYGFKPSMGRIPLYPGSRDERYPGRVGVGIAREHRTAEPDRGRQRARPLGDGGPDPRDRHSLPDAAFRLAAMRSRATSAALRVAYSADWGYAAVDPEVRRLVTAAVRVFERDLGCVVEEAHPGWDDPGAAFAALIVADTDLRGMRELARRYEGRMSPHLVDLLRRPWTAEDLTNANMTRKAVTNQMWRFMARYDLLLTPTLTVPPFAVHMQGPEKVDGRYVRPEQWLSFTYPMNMTGQPAASVPAGWTATAFPWGCRSSGDTSTTRWCCAPRRRSRRRRRGATAGRRYRVDP